MSLRYGFTFVNDRETIFPETYYTALEKLAESSGVTIGEYLFEILARHVEERGQVQIMDEVDRQEFKESWKAVTLDEYGRGGYDVSFDGTDDEAYTVEVQPPSERVLETGAHF